MLDRLRGTPRAGVPNGLQDSIFRRCQIGMHVAVEIVVIHNTNRKGTTVITSTIRDNGAREPKWRNRSRASFADRADPCQSRLHQLRPL